MPISKEENIKRIAEKKKRLLKTLALNKHLITSACKTVGVSKRQFYRYMNDDDDFREAVNEIREQKIDIAESVIMHHLEQNNLRAAEYLLDHLGANRGYGRIANARDENNPKKKTKILNIIVK